MATKPRSPNYPALSLSKALDFARKLYAVNHLHKASAEVVSKALGYTGLNGSSLTAIAALKKYGLIEEENKELRITQDALTVIVEPASSHERARTIVKLAHKPELFAELKATYPGTMPSDEILRAWFLRKGFIQSTVDTPIRAYRDTMELAEAQEGIYNSAASNQPPPPPPVTRPKIGDSVQWESNGALMFDPARAVVGLSPDDHYVFVEGSSTGIPVKEVTVIQAAPANSPQAPPVNPFASLAPGTRQDIFSLDEGQVVLQWPSQLSETSYEDLESWIQLQLRKIKRSIQ